jgi:hypothetical protein
MITETWLDDELALHYGLPSPNSSERTWVDVAAHGRRGILSHGSFLSAGNNVADTSPVLRGKHIRTRLLCQDIPEPPPVVMADEPPPKIAGSCKTDEYAAHATGSCADCHRPLDPVGFGLEQFDREGRFRAHDDDEPSCLIDGQGELVPYGPFVGPAGLAELLVDNGLLEACAVENVYRFTYGREIEGDDHPRVAALAQRFREAGRRFDALVMAVVSDPSFAFRRQPAGGEH